MRASQVARVAVGREAFALLWTCPPLPGPRKSPTTLPGASLRCAAPYPPRSSGAQHAPRGCSTSFTFRLVNARRRRLLRLFAPLTPSNQADGVPLVAARYAHWRPACPLIQHGLLLLGHYPSTTAPRLVYALLTLPMECPSSLPPMIARVANVAAVPLAPCQYSAPLNRHHLRPLHNVLGPGDGGSRLVATGAS